jgi:hypothetical protein
MEDDNKKDKQPPVGIPMPQGFIKAMIPERVKNEPPSRRGLGGSFRREII